MKRVTVIGAGLAGSEAAWQLAKRGVQVDLYEMRPVKQTPAHHTDQFAELVCSNSLRANQLTNAVGVLKEEMRQLDSLIMKAADLASVPAGGALAVDRHDFAGYVTETLKNHPNVTVHHEEIEAIPDGPTIVATGPLTSAALSESLKQFTGEDYLYFFDAAAPILDGDTIDREKVYLKSRYDKGEAAYLNCPMTEEEFQLFYDELINAEVVPLKEFEKEIYFEGCMPFEVLASRGLEDPKTGKRPYAVVQLRQDNSAGTLFNLVGFQTHLKWGEQKRIIRLIPGLENAEIVRYGVMHRNTFVNSPNLLKPTYQTRTRDDLFFAGQMTGVEGYVESAASGLTAGINAARLVNEAEPVTFPQETMMGAMSHYITTTEGKNFQPMNANFGLVPALVGHPVRMKKPEKYALYAERALEAIKDFTDM